MCYEFVRACDSAFIDRISSLVGDDNFFLVCIGHLNYFYCNDRILINLVKDVLSESGIRLHSLSERETVSVVNSPSLIEYEIFYGSRPLFDAFLEKWAVA